jgi:signal transduction histidine kinase
MAGKPNGRDGTPAARGAVAERPPAAAAPADLRRVERLFADCSWPDRATFFGARERARRHALKVLEGGSGARAQHTALLVAAAKLFRALSAAADAVSEGAHVAAQLEDEVGISPMELAREVVRGPELLTMAPDAACRALLSTLVGLVPLRSASLWSTDSAERPVCICHAGEGQPSRGAQQLARELVAGEAPDLGGRRLLLGLALGNRRPPVGALVGCASAGARERAHALFVEAGPMLAALVERDALLTANADAERALIAASERRLTRLGFDLHDGPIQDVAVLAQDLRLFRDQLELLLAASGEQEIVRGRLEDLDAQIVSLDGELRRLSGEVQAASVLLNRPFSAALADRVRAFTARTGIEPSVSVDGQPGELSTSQQIALLNIIQEALSNIREHAGASEVQITVSVDEGGVTARVVDDGRGFELEPTLMRAAREGRIGLIAMNERVRLLGGRCRIDSRPGGPTVVSVALERWLPLQTAGNGSDSA